MHPILIKIGGLTLYSYGLFVALGFIIALFFARRTARKNRVNPEYINDLVFIILISALLGSRLLYIFINFSLYKDDPISIFKIWDGGLVFYGGFLLAVITSFLYVKRKNLSFWNTADIIAPAIALGHAVGRIGCFFAGCCHGKQCTLPWAISFTDPNSLAPLGIPLHPTQLYSVLSNLLIFSVLLLLARFKKFNGMIFLSYIILYSIFRFIIEHFRGDFRGTFFNFNLSTAQGMGVVFGSAALLIFIYRYLKDNESD